jgi:hypothetical protein
MVATVIAFTSGTSWTLPVDWNPNNFSVEVIGGGGSGPWNSGSGGAGGGGGGGAYAKVTNADVTGTAPGQVLYFSIGAGGVVPVTSNTDGGPGGNTWARFAVNSAPTTVSEGTLAEGGQGGIRGLGGSSLGGAGGATANSIGSTPRAQWRLWWWRRRRRRPQWERVRGRPIHYRRRRKRRHGKWRRRGRRKHGR